MAAVAAVRRVYNDPRTTRYVERMVLDWLMHWDPSRDIPVRQYIALRAANEARRVRGMREDKRRRYLERALDAMRLTCRPHRPGQTVQTDSTGTDKELSDSTDSTDSTDSQNSSG